MNELTIHLNPKSKKPLYEQIYQYIKESIVSGNIAYGEKLPSTRLLAKHLDVSRSTVELAYEQLLSEGYVEALPYRGYFVSEIEGMYHLSDKKSRTAPEGTPLEKKYRYDFTPNGMDLKGFPYNAWRKLSKEILIDDKASLFRLGNPQGEQSFREAIASYLYQSRGISCHSDQIIVGAGSDFLLMILCMVLGRNHVVAVENPAYKQAFRMFAVQEYKVCPVTVDKHGMSVEYLRETGADIAYITPSHQFPTGIVMPVKRRLALLKWAQEQEGRYLIEDDYDSEFRYKGKPIPALLEHDKGGKVVYLGTFSKSIAPAIRMSFMVLPQELLSVYRKKCRFISSTVSKVDQLIVQRFIQEGYYERHLNRIRTLYKGRHDTLIHELEAFTPYAHISGEYSGVHLLLTFHTDVSERQLIDAAKEAGVKVYGLSEYILMEDDCSDGLEEGMVHSVAGWRELPTILLGFAILSEEEILEAVKILKEAWFPILNM